MAEPLPDGSNVEYACDITYTLVGPSIQYCDDGSWDASRPSCKGELQMRLALPQPRTDYVPRSFSHTAVPCGRIAFQLILGYLKHWVNLGLSKIHVTSFLSEVRARRP